VTSTDLSPVWPWPGGREPVCCGCARIWPNKRKREMSGKTGNGWGNGKWVYVKSLVCV